MSIRMFVESAQQLMMTLEHTSKAKVRTNKQTNILQF